MMGSCAFLMPISSVRFVRTRTYDVRAALGLALGGLPAVLIAAYVVQSMSLDAVRWLVVVVVVYTSLNMLMTAKADDGRGGRRCVSRSSSSPAPAAKSATAWSRASPASGSLIITLDVSPLDASLAPLVTREFTGSITDVGAARSHARGVRGRPRLPPRGAAVDALRVHAGHRAPRQRRGDAEPARVRPAARASRTAGRSSSSIPRRSPPTACPISRRRRAPAAVTRGSSSRIRRRCTGATSCIASSSGDYYARHYKQLSADAIARVDFRCVRFPGPDLGDDAAVGRHVRLRAGDDSRRGEGRAVRLLRAARHDDSVHGDARRRRRAAGAGGGAARAADADAPTTCRRSTRRRPRSATSSSRRFPTRAITYKVDAKRQGIVDSWPAAVDDSAARARLGLQPDVRLRSRLPRVPDPDDPRALSAMTRRSRHRVR